MGDPLNDYYPGSPNPTPTQPGFGPNTRTLLQFRVGRLVGRSDPPAPALKLPPIDPGPIVSTGPGVSSLPFGVKVRNLTLNEDFDEFGRLIQRLGTNVPIYPGTFARNYVDSPTETPKAGSIEAWPIFNLTGDTHPIHFHLVNVQIVSRQKFDVVNYNGKPDFKGNERQPDLNERGWKETVRMNPGEVTTVIMKFDLPIMPFVIPPIPRTGGHEYVWHCHILEHEEHDMMRPLIVGA
jgi:spore coat protein A